MNSTWLYISFYANALGAALCVSVGNYGIAVFSAFVALYALASIMKR